MMKKIMSLLLFLSGIFLENLAFSEPDVNNFLKVTIINNTNTTVYVKAIGGLDWESSCQSEIPPETTQRLCGDSYIPLFRGSYPIQDGAIYISYLQNQYNVQYDIHYSLERQTSYTPGFIPGFGGTYTPDNTKYVWHPLEVRHSNSSLTVMKDIEKHECAMNYEGGCNEEVILRVNY